MLRGVQPGRLGPQRLLQLQRRQLQPREVRRALLLLRARPRGEWLCARARPPGPGRSRTLLRAPWLQVPGEAGENQDCSPRGLGPGCWARCSECTQPGLPSSLSLHKGTLCPQRKPSGAVGGTGVAERAVLWFLTHLLSFPATAPPLVVRNLGRSRESLPGLSFTGRPVTTAWCCCRAGRLPAEGPAPSTGPARLVNNVSAAYKWLKN